LTVLFMAFDFVLALVIYVRQAIDLLVRATGNNFVQD